MRERSPAAQLAAVIARSSILESQTGQNWYLTGAECLIEPFSYAELVSGPIRVPTAPDIAGRYRSPS